MLQGLISQSICGRPSGPRCQQCGQEYGLGPAMPSIPPCACHEGSAPAGSMCGASEPAKASGIGWGTASVGSAWAGPAKTQNDRVRREIIVFSLGAGGTAHMGHCSSRSSPGERTGYTLVFHRQAEGLKLILVNQLRAQPGG